MAWRFVTQKTAKSKVTFITLFWALTEANWAGTYWEFPPLHENRGFSAWKWCTDFCLSNPRNHTLPLVIICNPNCCQSWSLACNTPEHQPVCCCCERQTGTFLVEIIHGINCICHLLLGRGVSAARMTPEDWSCLPLLHCAPSPGVRLAASTLRSGPLEIWGPQDLNQTLQCFFFFCR